MVPGNEGGITQHLPDGEIMSIYDAAMRYQEDGVPLVIVAGKEYGAGSSRDWAAKGPKLLGVRAVIAESFERIHRSNLIGMGVLPLQFKEGVTRRSLALTGEESLRYQRFCRRHHPGHGCECHAEARRWPQRNHHARPAGSIRWTRSNISAMAASCPMCCAGCAPRRRERGGMTPGPFSSLERVLARQSFAWASCRVMNSRSHKAISLASLALAMLLVSWRRVRTSRCRQR